MKNKLEFTLRSLGAYVLSHEEVKKIPDGEWMTFTVLICKKSEGIIQFTNPCLTTGIVNTNEYKKEHKPKDDDVIILNEYNYEKP